MGAKDGKIIRRLSLMFIFFILLVGIKAISFCISFICYSTCCV